MKHVQNNIFFLCLAGCLVPKVVAAHQVKPDVGEFYAGMMHAFLSPEHILPMTALALFISQTGSRTGKYAVFLFPAALIVAMGISPYLDAARPVHLANLIVIGITGILLMLFNRFNMDRYGVFIGISLTVFLGLILGYRSGIDMANAEAGLQFIPGIALTGLIFMTLFIAWLPKSPGGIWDHARTFCGIFLVIACGVLVFQYFTSESASLSISFAMPTQDSIKEMMARENLSAGFIFAALFASFLWGAGHALTPGHGKAIVGAYLVGAHSSALHAVYLGLTVTVTHTLGVFILGLIAVFASQYILPEDLYPYLGAVSGFIVLLLGVHMICGRIYRGNHHHHSNDHEHDHSHTHDHHGRHYDIHAHKDHAGHSHLLPGSDGSPVTWKSLLGLGISGGLLPCPSALVLLLAAVSLQRPEFGMAMVVCFSLGLAGILTCVGLLFVKGSSMIKGISSFERAAHYLPMASAMVIIIIGIVIIWSAARPLFL